MQKRLTRDRRRVPTLVAALVLAIGLMFATAAPAQAGQTYLGQLRLYDYCAAKYKAWPGTMRVYTVWPHDAGTWRCSFNAKGIGWVTVGFDMNAVCRWQYRWDAYARSYNWSSGGSWQCFR
jgi:hypothetical protein